MQCRGASAGGTRPSAARRTHAAVASAVVLVALVLVAVACTQESGAPAVTVPSTVSPLAAQAEVPTNPVPTLFYPPGYVPFDSRAVVLPAIAVTEGAQPPIPVFGGDAHIGGTVFGPDGPVEGGTVRLERFVGNRGGIADVPTGKGGRWDAVGLLGGHYRVRAWLRPNLATVEPQVAFVTDSKDTNLELSIGVEKHEAKRLQVALDTGNPRVGVPATLLVLHDQEDVDENGIIRGKPFVNTDVEVTVGAGLEVLGEPKAKTGLDGLARFGLLCTEPGPHDVSATGDGLTTALTLPDCLAPDAPVPEPGGSVLDSTTTTSPGDDSTTVPQDGPDEHPMPVGAVFTTPYSFEIPPGTYQALNDGATCSTDYQIKIGDRWTQSHTNGGRLIAQFPLRKLRPTEGTPSCTFRRTK